ELWRVGIAPGDVLLVADQSLEPVAALAGAATVVLGQSSVFAGDQLQRRREGDLPAPSQEPAWTFVVEGFDPERERVHEALLSLADGAVGLAGVPLLAHPSEHAWVVGSGAYEGEGPET